jgi:acetyl esterase/lipase
VAATGSAASAPRTSTSSVVWASSSGRCGPASASVPRIWDDDLDALRPQLREEASAFLAQFSTAPDDPAAPVAARIAAQRAAHLSDDLTSQKAVDREIAGPAGPIRLRTFVPDRVDGVMLHLHGGGFIAGSPEMTDLLNEVVADSVHVAVVSVDYRLAPEHPYPAGPDDCEAAALWLLEHADAEFGSSRLLIGGESAGAHLSAATLLRLRDRHGAAGRVLGANLVFGIYDLSGTPSQHGVGVPGPDMVNPDFIRLSTEAFTPGRTPMERRDPDISPLYAELHGMPPALFSVGAHDHLLHDTLLLAARWELAGNRTELVVYPEAPHGFLGMPSLGAHFFPRMLGFLEGCLAAES